MNLDALSRLPGDPGGSPAPAGSPASRGLALSLVTVLCWGLLPIALKGLLARLDSGTITWFRFLVATLVLGAWHAAHRQLPCASVLAVPRTAGLLAAATLGLAGNYLLYLWGLDQVTPATAQTVVQIAPLLLLAASLAVFREPFSRLQAMGVATFVLGLGLFFDTRLGELLSSLTTYSRGVAWVVLAALLWAGYGLAQKCLQGALSASVVLWIVYLGSTVLLLPIATPGNVLALDATGLGLLAFASANTLVAYGAFAEALACWEATRVSAVLASTPLATALFAELAARLVPGFVPAETWTPTSILGACLVVAGSATAALGKAPVR